MYLMKNQLPSASWYSKESPKRVFISFLIVLFWILCNQAMAQDDPERTQANGTGVVTVTANGGSCLGFTAAVGTGPDNWEVAEGGSYTMTITGVTECNDNAITVFVQNSSAGNFCFNATGDGSGTYIG